MDNYKILRKIGSGSFSKVFLAEYIKTGQQVALKLVDKRENKSIKATRRINREITNMKLLQGHHNIVNVFDDFETPKHFVIAMEYVSGGELFDYVQKKDGMNEISAHKMFTSIVHGVQHCHKNGITHRDLKLENILLDEDNQPKIADFGFSKNIPSSPLTASSIGSPMYSSPEIILGKPYQGPECDVWSLGVILYTMLTATMPFDDSNIGQFLLNIRNGDYPEPCGISSAVKDLIHKMLDPNSATRFTLGEILTHPWMTDLCKKVASHLPKKKRKQAVSYENSEYIYKEIKDFNKCSCSYHNSGLGRHCEDCSYIQANKPKMLLRRSTCLSNSSLNSSGSQYWQSISISNLSNLNIPGLELSTLEGRRASMPCPQNSSAGTLGSDSTVPRKMSHYNFSVPVQNPATTSEHSEVDGIDDVVVFV